MKVKTKSESGQFWRKGFLPSLGHCHSHRWFCTLIMCNQLVDGWSPIIFHFVLTPGISLCVPLTNSASVTQSHSGVCHQHLLYLHRRVFLEAWDLDGRPIPHTMTC